MDRDGSGDGSNPRMPVMLLMHRECDDEVRGGMSTMWCKRGCQACVSTVNVVQDDA